MVIVEVELVAGVEAGLVEFVEGFEGVVAPEFSEGVEGVIVGRGLLDYDDFLTQLIARGYLEVLVVKVPFLN